MDRRPASTYCVSGDELRECIEYLERHAPRCDPQSCGGAPARRFVCAVLACWARRFAASPRR